MTGELASNVDIEPKDVAAAKVEETFGVDLQYGRHNANLKSHLTASELARVIETRRVEGIKLLYDTFKHFSTLSGIAIGILLNISPRILNEGARNSLSYAAVELMTLLVISLLLMISAANSIKRGTQRFNLKFFFERIKISNRAAVFIAVLLGLGLLGHAFASVMKVLMTLP